MDGRLKTAVLGSGKVVRFWCYRAAYGWHWDGGLLPVVKNICLIIRDVVCGAKKNLVSMENMRIFAPDFESEILTYEVSMPHSSSGPGHLPLTQKIISSTLICGTPTAKHSCLAVFLYWVAVPKLR